MSGMRWTEDQLRAHQQRAPMPKTSPFKNVRTTDGDGRVHASKLECSRWQELKQLEAFGEIRKLRAQVPFALTAENGAHVGVYIADAVYEDAKTGKEIVEDSKGRETPIFKWKARHFKAQYGFEITIVRKAK